MTKMLKCTEKAHTGCNVSNNTKNLQILLNLYGQDILDINATIVQVADNLNISQHVVGLYTHQFKYGDC